MHILQEMKNKKYHTVGTIPKSNIEIVERGNIYTPNSQIHNRLVHINIHLARYSHFVFKVRLIMGWSPDRVKATIGI